MTRVVAAAAPWHSRRMTRILAAGALLIMLAVSAAAAEIPYGFAFARPGMTIDELRAAKLPAGHRLLCGGDKDLPASLSDRDRGVITMDPDLVRIGLTRCGVFAKDESGAWTARLLELAGNPANFWMLLITDEAGRQRLAQINMRQRRESFATTLAVFTQSFGPPTRQDPLSAHWVNSSGEIAIVPSEPAGIYIFIVDNLLYELMTARMGAGKGK